MFVHTLLLLLSCSLLNAQEPTLSVTSTIVNEGDPFSACVMYENLPATETSIVVSTRDGLQGGATSPTDYTPVLETLIFSSTSPLQQCVDISILRDSAVENLQRFQILAVMNNIAISGSPADVLIQSRETLTIGFAQSSYSFLEDTGGQVCVVIEEGTVERSVPFSVTFTDGTASESNLDYNPAFLSGVTLAFDADTPPEGVCFSTTMVPDNGEENDETFIITLSTDPSLTLNPASNQVTVTILNDDANCPSPPTLENGNFSVSDTTSFTFGAIANYSCIPGYQLVGESVLTCQSGNVWSPTTPGTCEAACPLLTDLPNGTVEQSQRTIGSIAMYSCNGGYILEGEATRECLEDRSWSGSAPTCRQAAECDPLGAIANGGVDDSQRFEGDMAIYTCDDGYGLVGDSMRTCGMNGEWSGSEPNCAIQCPGLPNIDNGNVDISNRFVNGIATYMCNQGFTLIGQNERTCQMDRQWSGSEPTCDVDPPIAAECNPLGAIANGVVNDSQRLEGDMATYTCDDGYGLVGNSIRTCGMNGEWSGSEPNCAVQCPDLPNIDNGNVNISNRFVNGIATYMCNQEFTLLGQNERTCQMDRQWSGSEPTCDVDPPIVLPPGGLSSEEMIGLGVGLGVGLVVVLVLVIVAVVVMVWYFKSKRKDKYVLNYSTVYGNQRKNELTSRPVEPAQENDYGEAGTSEHESAVDVPNKNGAGNA